MTSVTFPGAAVSYGIPSVSTWMRRHRDALVLTLLCSVGFMLRLAASRGLWLDETTSVGQADRPFLEMIAYLRATDLHPPLFHSVLWASIHAFGTSELAVRIPSVIIGVALVPTIYAAGKEMFDAKTAFLAALLAAIGPSTVWYSQEARMYPLFMLLALITVWMQVRIVRGAGTKSWVVFTAASIALLWTHYFAALHVAAGQLVFIGLIVHQRRSRKRLSNDEPIQAVATPSQQVAKPTAIWRPSTGYLNVTRSIDAVAKQAPTLAAGYFRSLAALIIGILPLAALTYGQLQAQAQRGLPEVPSRAQELFSTGAPIYRTMDNLASVLVGYHSRSVMASVVAFWPLAMLLAFVLLGRRYSKLVLYLVGMTLIPMSVLFLVGLRQGELFELRYFAGAVPVILLLVARGLTTISSNRFAYATICVFVAAGLAFSLNDSENGKGNTRIYDYRSTLQEVSAAATPDDLVVYEPFYLRPTMDYYAPDVNARPLADGVPSIEEPRQIVIVSSSVFADRAISEQRVKLVLERLHKERTLVKHTTGTHLEVWTFS